MNEESGKEFHSIYLSVSRYCAAVERSKRQVCMKLKRLEAPDSVCGSMLQMLETEGYLDEKRYAASFIHDKLLFNKWGRVKMEYLLRQDGVGETAIKAGLETIDPDEYMRVLRSVVESKRREIKDSSPYAYRRTLMRKVAARGFETDLINMILEEEQR